MTTPTRWPEAPLDLRLLRRLILSLPRGRHVFLRWFTPLVAGRPPFRASFDGNRQFFVAALRNRVARTIYFYGLYEQVQTAILLHILRPGQVMIDAGANIGYFSLLAARRVGPSGRVVAFEPEPENAALLRQNAALNHHLNITVEETAVAGGDGVARLGSASPDRRDGDAFSTVQDRRGSEADVIDVPAVGLDAYCRRNGIARVDILKMDIEGGEADALAGMRDGIRAGLYRRVFLELHPAALKSVGRTPEDVLAAFLEQGYSCWQLPDYPPGFLSRYSLRFTDALLVPYTGAVRTYWPHLLLTAPGVPLAEPPGVTAGTGP